MYIYHIYNIKYRLTQGGYTFLQVMRDAMDYLVKNQPPCSVNQLEVPAHVAIFFDGLAAIGDRANTGIKIEEVSFTDWIMTDFVVHVRGKVSGEIPMDPLLVLGAVSPALCCENISHRGCWVSCSALLWSEAHFVPLPSLSSCEWELGSFPQPRTADGHQSWWQQPLVVGLVLVLIVT